ncbi:MAG: cytochrome c3 family protein [Myxococcota bacterium]
MGMRHATRGVLIGLTAAAVALAVASTVVHADEDPTPISDEAASEAPETAPAEAEPAEATPVEAEPAEAAPAEAKPSEAAPAEAKPSEAAPAEAKPSEAAPAEPAKGALAIMAIHAGSPDDPLTWAGQDALRSKNVGRQHTPSREIFPDQTLPFRFSHRIHVAEDLDCTDCHDSATTSVRSKDVVLPIEETCFDCHDVNDGMMEPDESDPPAACTICHPGYIPEFPEGFDAFDETHHARVAPARIVIPEPHLKFNHKVHIDKGFQCTECHGDMADVDLATRENALPTMGKCLECHDGQQAPDECRTCHLTLPDGRIDTMASGVPLKPAGWYMADAHDESFLKDHRMAAQMNDGYCENCHKPKFCLDCHNGVQKPLKYHPNNWTLQHPIAARKNSPDCNSCHRIQTFCVNCHQQTQVSWESNVAGVGREAWSANGTMGVDYHPEGWVYPGRGPDHHARHAQRNIRACASCHTEQTCLECHSLNGSFGPAAISPHPPGFANSTLCRGMAKRNHRACVKCHTQGSPNMNCLPGSP